MSITTDLDALHSLRQQLEATRLRMAELTNAVISPEQHQEIAAIALEFAPTVDALTAAITATEDQIKADVLTHGATVKSAYMQAVYMKGRISWDPKALDGYSLAHPELLAFRSESAPSVSLRGVK